MKLSVCRLTILSFSAFLLSSCTSSTSTSSGLSAERPSGLIAAVGDAIEATGSGLGGSRLLLEHNGKRSTILMSENCDEHGEPKTPGTGTYLNTSDARYPGLLTFCKMKINDGSPDTIQGAFEMPRKVSCALEKAGLIWDGAPHSVPVTLDTDCFSADQLTEMGMTSMTATITASSPATNPYFDKSIEMTVPGFGTYAFMTKVSGTSIEFLTKEDQGADKMGVFAGSYDTSTGEVRYEGRMERMNCAESGSCGWNRHIRVYADLEVTAGSPGDLQSISFGYSNIQSPPGQMGYSGNLVTASGTTSTGMKARVWNATDGSLGAPTSTADYSTVANWVETPPNAYCYTPTDDSALTCGSGIDKFTVDAQFTLNTGAGHQSPSTYYSGYSGMTFTSVDLDIDNP